MPIFQAINPRTLAAHSRTDASCWRAACFLATLLVNTSASATEPLDEVSATRAVCENGPVRTVAEAMRTTGRAIVTAARVLPNPSLVGSYQSTFLGVVDRELMVGLSVPLGLGGRRFILNDAAEQRLRQAEAQADATVFESAIAFREAFAAAAIAQQRVLVRTEQQKALDELKHTITGLQIGGEASAYDLLRQSSQARLHRGELEMCKADALALRADLEAWMGPEVALSLTELDASSPLLPIHVSDAFDAPKLRSLIARSDASELEARAARRQWVPDVDVSAAYRKVGVGAESGHGVALGLTVPLTLFDHGQGEAARANAEQQLAGAQAEQLRRHQRAQLKGARLRLDLLEARATEARAVSVEAGSIRDKARQLYEAGEATITEVLEAFRGAEAARLAELDLSLQIALTRLTVMKEAGSMYNSTLDQLCGGTRSTR